ncbi:MAG: penicillin acylase family protein, partial [Chitinophagaceae bacterium]|nr:penicillin acylase family protein [Chitinophagaceae bacterium]
MRILRAIWPLILSVTIIYWLNKPIGANPAIGKLLDPVSGFWANAEPADKDFTADLTFHSLKGDASVWYDDRLVPHITATNDYDLYFVQGYIHAYFRLWQMDLQTRAAGGRVSELLGPKALKYDREQRRKGMVYGAEQSLKAMEADPRSKIALDGYRDGINEYIASLRPADYPVEYKLMGFKPEPWENLRTTLLLMYMADDLAGDVHDIGLTYYLQNILSKEQVAFFFPEKISGSTPVIPAGTKFDPVSMQQAAVPEGDKWAKVDFKKTPEDNSESGKGSNNWALSGSRTRSGKPILCNDPHLALNLPSLWFQVQLTAPGINVYGVSLPGAPGVVIGYNDNIAWGFTNNYRDVKDFYTIDVVDNDHYRFNGENRTFDKRIETIKIKGGSEFIDTVRYTLHGPLIYDEHFKEPNGIQQPLALKWMALEESNEMLSLYLLNRAKDYDGYAEGISYFSCPAQNFIFADTKGDIAIWGQGQFVNKWKEQGKYIMQGCDSTTLWGSPIPVSENPHVKNPQQGFLSSANQNVTDT